MLQRHTTSVRKLWSTRTRGGERGSALVIALVVVFAASVMAAIMSMMSSVDLKISGNQRGSTRALYAAEAGLNEAVHRLSLLNPTIGTVGPWTGNVAISDTPPYDPEWTARIYLTSPGAAPPAAPGEFHTGTLQDLGGDYARYSTTSGTRDVLTIQHKWVDLDSDDDRDDGEIVLYDPSQIPAENFVTGFPIEVVSVTGSEGQGVRKIEAEVTKFVILARTLGALYIDKALTVKGTPAFCGHNHDIATPPNSAPNACFAWHLAGGGLPGVTTTGDEVEVKGSASDIIGVPTPMDTSSTNPFYNLAEVLGVSTNELTQLLDNPHNTSIVNPLNGITYINGNAKINSNLTGEGLIYVTGDLTGSGGFEYKGLIYVEGDLKFTGNPWVLGSIVVRGTTDFNFSAGSAELLYSRDAIQNYVGQYFPMVRLSWREH